MNLLYDHLSVDPENPLYLLIFLIGSVWLISFMVFLWKYISYKKLNVLKVLEDKTAEITTLVEDYNALARVNEELKIKSSTLERQIELKIAILERASRTLEEENITLKSRLESGDTFKDEMYRTIVNLFLETRTLFWTGTLENMFLTPIMALGLSPNDVQLETIEKLSKLKNAYYKNDIVIRDLIKNGPTKWGALEDGLLRGLPIQEVTLVVPTKDVIKMQADAFIACSKLDQGEIENTTVSHE